VVRFLCRRKGKPKLKDRTFSLLPYFLIPYQKFTINSAMKIIGNKLVKGKSKKEIADDVYNSFDIDSNFNFEERYIDYWIKLFRQAVLKLMIFLDKNNQDTDFLKGNKSMHKALVYLNEFTDDTKRFRNATGFSVYYYQKQGGYRENPQFLFGTAYQFL